MYCNLKPSKQLVKSIQCCDFFGIPLTFDLNKDIQFTTEEFNALLDIVCKVGYDENYFQIIKQYFPHCYYFTNPRSELYYDTLKYAFNKYMIIVINENNITYKSIKCIGTSM